MPTNFRKPPAAGAGEIRFITRVRRWCEFNRHDRQTNQMTTSHHLNFALCTSRGLLILLTLAGGLASAATNAFVTPTFRGSANSAAGYWEVFTVAAGAPGNLPDGPGSTTSAVFTQHSPNGFLTGSGNIYNFADASAFTLTDTTSFTLGTVILQTRTVGSELDYHSVQLNYTDGSGSHSVSPLFRLELDRSLSNGANVSSLWQWDLSGLGVSSYSIAFAAAESSMSFDSLTLDTWNQFSVVPEPSVAALGGIAGMLLLARARISRRLGKH